MFELNKFWFNAYIIPIQFLQSQLLIIKMFIVILFYIKIVYSRRNLCYQLIQFQTRKN